MTNKQTKRDLKKKLKQSLDESYRLSNELMSFEKHSHTKNGSFLYNIRQDINSSQTRVTFLNY